MRSFKEDPDPGLARLLARPLARRLATEAGHRGSGSDEAGETWDLVLVPVPMAPVRRRERGWNPPERLTEALASMLDESAKRPGAGPGAIAVRVEPDLLRRRRYRRPLRGLGARERRREVAGAFEAPGRLCGANERIWLIDDVFTTGATLGAAAATLTASGHEVCGALVLARTPRRERAGVAKITREAGRPAS